MELIRLEIPAAFVLARASMSWRDVQFGLVNELIAARSVTEYAIEALSRVEVPDGSLLELLERIHETDVRVCVEQLASREPQRAPEDARDKWLYLTLAWLYDERSVLVAPLRMVDYVYADFGYPEEVAHFVPMMANDQPSLGSREANEARLMQLWKRWLDESATRYGPRGEGEAASPLSCRDT